MYLRQHDRSTVVFCSFISGGLQSSIAHKETNTFFLPNFNFIVRQFTIGGDLFFVSKSISVSGFPVGIISWSKHNSCNIANIYIALRQGT